MPLHVIESDQGAIVPTLFIGLGGTGSRIVDRIAARAMRLPQWGSRLEPLVSFLTLDTNEKDQHRLVAVPPGNRFNIAAFDKARAVDGYRRSDDPRALQWLDRAYQPRPGAKPGAGQIRVESRLGFFYYSQEIRDRLRQVIQATLMPGITWRQAQPPKYEVYIYCTLAGGTGSGAFLSMAYLVDAVIREASWQPRVIGNLLLSTLLVDKVAPELHPDIHANTYAALKEVEYLTRLDYQQTKDEGRRSDEFVYIRDDNSTTLPRVETRPFFLGLIYDRPPHISVTSVEDLVADTSFLQLFSPIIDNLAGELDNYEKRQWDLTTLPGQYRNVGQGYSKNFGAYGAAALVLPGRDLLCYCSLRFAAQAIRAQITFGVDPAAPPDDRARALARLAVDYGDPKFARMGEDAREAEINRAFAESVREMARQDEREGIPSGYWATLVESVDLGPLSGVDEKGEARRGESLVARVERILGEQRRDLLNDIAIRERAFVFHKEGVNQYIELVSRLKEEIRVARKRVDEGAARLETSARGGELVLDLRLNPTTERYLSLRLLDLVEKEWIPSAEAQLSAARLKDIENPVVRERLEKELYENLQRTSRVKKLGILNDDQAFLNAREEAQEYYRDIGRAARKVLDAELRLRQLRRLLDFLRARTHQYAQLATRMDRLVQDLEGEAQRYRRGELSVDLPFALRVEVFETLDEPRRRVWDEVYQALFIDQGAWLTTFDRQVLATTISEQLAPELRDGRLVEKAVDDIVKDVRAALIALGMRRLGPAILGDDRSSGLDIEQGLRLEARILNRAPDGSPPSREQVDAYLEKKIRAFDQLTGVLARVDSAQARSVDDGVTVYRGRQLVVGVGPGGATPSAQAFIQRIRSLLTPSGKNLNLDTWSDPRLMIVHDVEIGIPLYYFPAIVGEIEDPYLTASADERRSYNLHTDMNWEKTLPNLNPRRSEVGVGWALKTLADGLVTGVISGGQRRWTWNRPGRDAAELGQSLSGALYRLGEMHRNVDLSRGLEDQIAEGMVRYSAEERTSRRRRLATMIEGVITDMSQEEVWGVRSRTDLLDRPALRALLSELRQITEPERKARTGGYDLSLDD